MEKRIRNIKNFLKLANRASFLISVGLLALSLMVLYSGYFPDVIQTIMRIIFGGALFIASYAVYAISSFAKRWLKERIDSSGLTLEESLKEFCERHPRED